MGLSKYDHEEVQLSEKIRQLLKKGGFEIIWPEGMNNLCCGMAFLSKGYKEAGLKKSKELEAALWKASNEGEYPILCDMSPCLYTMKENMELKRRPENGEGRTETGDRRPENAEGRTENGGGGKEKGELKLYEPVEFILEYLVPHLDITPIEETISVFPVCSAKKMEIDRKLVSLASLCAREVVVPETNCCGFAGDRGFTFPELNKHGLRELKAQLPPSVKQGYSTSRTCEIGLSLHSGINYKSIVYLVDRVSTPKAMKEQPYNSE